MSKLLIKLSMISVIVFSMIACDGGEGSGRSRKKKGDRKEVQQKDLPAKGAKIAFIFPAGAGAMRTILGVTAELEKDLGIQGLGSIIDVAGGVSSGSLVAAALTYDDPPKVTSSGLKTQIGGLVRKVFPDTNVFVDKLINDYKFTLDELEALFKEIMKAPPDLSSPAAAETGLGTLLATAAISKFSIKKKMGDPATFLAAIAPELAGMVGQETVRATVLADTIKDDILGDTPLSDPKAAKFMAFATADDKPAFFGAPAFATAANGPYAVGATKLHEALVASSAIPRFIKAPSTINFTMPGGGTKNLPDLKDGVFATVGRFDPSAVFFDIFKRYFADEDLIIVFVGNGAPLDTAFRTMLKDKYEMANNIAQETLSNGKKVTFVAIDTKIKDGNGNDLFNLSGFYDSKDLAKYMDKGASDAVKSPAYSWTVKALKAAIK